MRPTIAVLRLEPTARLGHFRSAFSALSYSCRNADIAPAAPNPLADLNWRNRILLMGGVGDIDLPGAPPVDPKLLAALTRIAAFGRPILAVGRGAEVLCLALGGKVGPPAAPVGWRLLALTSAGGADPLTRSLPSELPGLYLPARVCLPPPQARVLLTCGAQPAAFAVGSAYALCWEPHFKPNDLVLALATALRARLRPETRDTLLAEGKLHASSVRDVCARLAACFIECTVPQPDHHAGAFARIDAPTRRPPRGRSRS
ncbi:MAG TPA: hypothetical protein VG389_02730 [Myxococcota bacterium]|jgi:GMP synthase-like glutamine amidotransferase|nr:hypothetical protein [Myxococcota bacterium]